MGYICIPCKECIILAKLRREETAKATKGPKKEKKSKFDKTRPAFLF